MYDYAVATAEVSAGNSFAALVGSLSPMLISLPVSVLSIISMWLLFQKAGEGGWKAIIPFYNLYTQFKLTWKTSIFWIMLACMIAGPFLAGILAGIGGRLGALEVILLIICPVIAALVLSIISYVKLGKAYGKSSGFCVGLVFLSVIFQCIMAFDKNTTYAGPQQ